MDWAEGYHVDLDYTFGYYHELGPAHLRFVCLTAGVECEVPDAPTYLELGFGQGVSINLHAAGSEGVFWGADFNPSHAVHARKLAAASGADVRLSDESFAAFAERPDLPEFDVIALHGVWSWVSAANRDVVVDLIRRRLRPGGLVYVSYNCMPGWAARGPVRHLLALGRGANGAGRGGARAEVDQALAFLDEVVAANPKFFADVGPARKHAAGLGRQSRRYLAHEYFNDEWHVPYFSEVAEALAEAKLTFVDSARLLDRVSEIHLTREGAALLDGAKDAVLRESLRDYLVNQRFRPDVFIKGAVQLSALEQDSRLNDQAFVLICPLDEIEFRLTGALGQATLPEAIYRPVSEALAAEAFRMKTAGRLIETTGLSGKEVHSALTVLIGMGVVRPAAQASDRVRRQCEAYNGLVLERALTGRQLKHLASPLTGGGVLTTRSTQLFLAAWLEGVRTPDALADHVWSTFERTNERAVNAEGEAVSKKDNLIALRKRADRFLTELLPLYRALGVLSVSAAAPRQQGGPVRRKERRS